MSHLDRLCIVVAAMAEVGYRKEAMEMAKTCRALWMYKPLWGIIKDVSGPTGRTRLMYCAEHGYVDGLEWLIRHGANTDIQDSAGYTALHLAILNSQMEAAIALIVAGANLNLATMDDGDTPLLYAPPMGDTRCFIESVAAGKSTCEKRTYGETPLMLACMRATELVRILCDMGADVHVKNFQGQTALQYALVAGNIQSAIVLQNHGAKIPRVRKVLRTN